MCLKSVAIAFPIAQLLLLVFIIHNLIPFAFQVVRVSACVSFFSFFFKGLAIFPKASLLSRNCKTLLMTMI